MKKITFKVLTKLSERIISSGLILIIILFLYGIIGSVIIMNMDFLNALYYTTITMATVGYGDLIPVTPAEKIFATTLAIGGVGLLAYVFNMMLSTFQEKMSNYSKEVRKMKAIEMMNDYYIICGYGRVGKVVFKELRKRNQNIIILDKSAEICEKLKKYESEKVIILNIDATESELISKLSGEKCRSVILSTGNDVTNIFIVFAIRESNPDAWIVSRASKVENISRLKTAGANKIVSPEISGGKKLFLESSKPHVLRLTVKHSVDEIFREYKIISKHGCTLENIDYHFPGIETPLNREIIKKDINEGKQFSQYLNENPEAKKALVNLYNNVNNIHSHLISCPDREAFDNLIKDLEKNEEILGKNLSDKEIANLTKKEIKI